MREKKIGLKCQWRERGREVRNPNSFLRRMWESSEIDGPLFKTAYEKNKANY